MSFKLKRVESLFPTPLVITEFEGSAALNAKLLEEIIHRSGLKGTKAGSSRHGFQSTKDLFERREPAHRQLAEAITKMVVHTTKQMIPETDLAKLDMALEGWVNINPSGGFNAPHDHPGAFWSGVYYVAMPPESDEDSDGGAIEFLAHRPSSFFVKMLPAPMTSNSMRLRPKPGMALMFPGTLRHWVYPHQSDAERVTVAFNAQFRHRRGS